MTDKYIVLDMHTFANETVAGYLTTFANGGAFLYFYKRTYPAVITDTAAIRVHEIEYLNILTYLYIIQALLFVFDTNLFYSSI